MVDKYLYPIHSLYSLKKQTKESQSSKSLGVKYLKTINIICGKVGIFVCMNKELDQNNLKEGEDYYITPEGYRCFTEKYHLKRGHCCKSGCRHCPYGLDKQTGTIKK
jgi:hypothetical protein